MHLPADQQIVLDTGQVAMKLPEPAAVEYMRRKMESGMRLGALVSPMLPLRTGSFYAVVPAGTEPPRALRFDSGGLRWDGSSLLAAVALILDALHANQGSVLLTEEILASPGKEAFLSRRQPSHRVLDDEAYHFVPRAEAAMDWVYYIMGLSDSGFSLNAVVGRDPGFDPGDGDDFVRFLDVACVDPYLLLVRAYDGEGFIVWQRDPAG